MATTASDQWRLQHPTNGDYSIRRQEITRIHRHHPRDGLPPWSQASCLLLAVWCIDCLCSLRDATRRVASRNPEPQQSGQAKPSQHNTKPSHPKTQSKPTQPNAKPSQAKQIKLRDATRRVASRNAPRLHHPNMTISHTPHGSFTVLAFQLATFTKYLNEVLLSYCRNIQFINRVNLACLTTV